MFWTTFRQIGVALLFVAGCTESKDEHTHMDMEYDLSREQVTDGETWTVSWTSDPDPIPFNDYFTMTFSVVGPDAADTSFDLAVEMPEHGHGMQVEPTIGVQEDGTTTLEGLLFHMEGHWELRGFVTDANQESEMAEFHVMCCD